MSVIKSQRGSYLETEINASYIIAKNRPCFGAASGSARLFPCSPLASVFRLEEFSTEKCMVAI